MRYGILIALFVAAFALLNEESSAQFWILTALAVVAFLLASAAAQSWRALLALAVLSAVLYWPVKWIAAGTWFAADSLTFGSEPWQASFKPSGAFVAAIVLASIAMILTARRPHTPSGEGRRREPLERGCA